VAFVLLEFRRRVATARRATLCELKRTGLVAVEDFIQKVHEWTEENIDDDEARGEFEPLINVCRH
jgi:hypothetical protein